MAMRQGVRRKHKTVVVYVAAGFACAGAIAAVGCGPDERVFSDCAEGPCLPSGGMAGSGDGDGMAGEGGNESRGGAVSGGGGTENGAGGSPGGAGVGEAGSGPDMCALPALDCDGSGECATDGATDPEHCGSCETKCAQQCRAGVCADPIQVSVGFSHACALLSDGSVWCWGSNLWGELGPGHADGATAPVRIELPQAATAVQAGGSAQETGDPLAVSCAILQDETVRCWGAGKVGGLGHGLTTDSAEPVELKGVTNVSQLSLGAAHGCAVTGSGKLYCWGFNEDGQVGNGLTANLATPVSVLTGVNQVSCGGAHTCARKSNGDVFCWGSSASGQLGIANLPPSTKTPLVVPGMNDTDELSLGSNHTLARKGSVTYGWGHDYSGQVNATFSYVTTPVQVDIDDNPPAAKRVVAGTNISGVVGTDDTLTVWGSAFHGDGEGSTGYAPAEINVGKVLDVSFGKNFGDGQTVCVIKANHELACWGSDTYGQVGNGDPVAEVRTPAAIAFQD
jgi:alpha-tubulin suppressor-like RCC1 family protein